MVREKKIGSKLNRGHELQPGIRNNYGGERSQGPIKNRLAIRKKKNQRKGKPISTHGTSREFGARTHRSFGKKKKFQGNTGGESSATCQYARITRRKICQEASYMKRQEPSEDLQERIKIQ